MAKKRVMKKSSASCDCRDLHMHIKKKAGWMLVFGVLVAANAWYGWIDAWVMFGGLIALGALLKLIAPAPMCCR